MYDLIIIYIVVELRVRFDGDGICVKDMYQAWLDGDHDISIIPKEEDPFWEPVEDALIGTANIFLQSLGYVLDFDDTLTITDLKGNDEGVLNVYIAPCSEKGRPLGEEHYVDEPKELLGSPYHFKVCSK